MPKYMTITSEPPLHPGMHFALLRKGGIEHIQRMAGHIWTDYNTHDPGITILEQLCYAITDLSYRLDFDIRDLLAYPPEEASSNGNKQFFTAREILTVNPLTINDFRKLIIDIDGVKNAWLEKSENPSPEIWFDPEQHKLTFEASELGEQVRLNGLYSVLIEKEEDTFKDDTALIDEVRSRLSRHRNLCEDFDEIKILPLEEIDVRADIVIEEDCDADELMAEIRFGLEDFISPPVRFCTLKEMVAKGWSAEEIFDGPQLEHGFIDEEQLGQVEKRAQLHTSDLVHIILDIPGVKTVKSFNLSGRLGSQQEWALDLDPEYAPGLKGVDSINLYKGEIACTLNPDKIEARLASLKVTEERAVSDDEKDLPISLGDYRELYDYESIQGEFPVNYGIGHLGLPDSATPKRKAQAKQLQAYLLFFDQILANYFSQLDHVKDLLSMPNTETRTCFSQMLSKAPGVKDILKTDADGLQELTEAGGSDLKRRNRLLDHLIACFSEKFIDHSLLLHKSLSKDFIQDKAGFIKEYPQVSAERGRAFDYAVKSGIWDTENVSGLKKRIIRMLGISDYTRRSLASSGDEGFHLVEHILLRPEKSDGREGPFLNLSKQGPDGNTVSLKSPDPYSFRMSFVFPNWPERFMDESFKKLVLETLSAETPAHIAFNVLWLDSEKMKNFEDRYMQWLQKKAEGSDEAEGHAGRLIELLRIGKVGNFQCLKIT